MKKLLLSNLLRLNQIKLFYALSSMAYQVYFFYCALVLKIFFPSSVLKSTGSFHNKTFTPWVSDFDIYCLVPLNQLEQYCHKRFILLEVLLAWPNPLCSQILNHHVFIMTPLAWQLNHFIFHQVKGELPNEPVGPELFPLSPMGKNLFCTYYANLELQYMVDLVCKRRKFNQFDFHYLNRRMKKLCRYINLPSLEIPHKDFSSKEAFIKNVLAPLYRRFIESTRRFNTDDTDLTLKTIINNNTCYFLSEDQLDSIPSLILDHYRKNDSHFRIYLGHSYASIWHNRKHYTPLATHLNESRIAVSTLYSQQRELFEINHKLLKIDLLHRSPNSIYLYEIKQIYRNLGLVEPDMTTELSIGKRFALIENILKILSESLIKKKAKFGQDFQDASTSPFSQS